MSASTVVHRSAAEIPVVVPMRASTETVNAVRWPSVFSLPDTMSGSCSSSSRSPSIGKTDHAARVADHERHLVGRHLLGGDDEIAFVLAVLVVDDDDELAALDRVDRALDGFERS